MKLKQAAATLLFVALLLQISSGLALAVTVTAGDVRKIAAEFACNCGCGKLVSNCDDKGCGPVKREFIKTQMLAGKTKDEIFTIMKAQYGSEILAAPEKSGFQLVAWIFPFALIFAGAVSVVMVMRSWIAARRQADAESGGSDDDDKGGAGSDHTYDSRIDKDLKEFDW